MASLSNTCKPVKKLLKKISSMLLPLFSGKLKCRKVLNVLSKPESSLENILPFSQLQQPKFFRTHPILTSVIHQGYTMLHTSYISNTLSFVTFLKTYFIFKKLALITYSYICYMTKTND